jgi:hypothetical protein
MHATLLKFPTSTSKVKVPVLFKQS